MPLERYFRERIFEPLGMADTDLVRSERVASRLATGYALRSRTVRRPSPTASGSAREPAASTRPPATWPGSSRRCWAAARTSTDASSSRRRWRRCSSPTTSLIRGCRAWASGSSARDAGGHRVVGHDGILPGFNSELLVAPDDGVGVIALHERLERGVRVAGDRARAAAARPARRAREAIRDATSRTTPRSGRELCGRYVFPPRIADLRGRLMLDGGAEVFVRGGRPHGAAR